jgi:hypothetical protein
MAYEDPLFPLPAPDWILTFDVILHRTSQLVEDSDSEGYPIKTGAAAVPIKAYVGPPDTRELARGGEAADVTVLVRNDIAISHRDQIEVPITSTLPAQMSGTFRVLSLRPNPGHTRALCSRVTDPDGAVR